MQAARTAILVVADNGTETVVGHLPRRTPDLGLIDALLRRRLHAGRCGRAIRLRDPSAELCDLLELVGLGGVLGLEPRGQPELREQRDGDEVVQPDDGAA